MTAKLSTDKLLAALDELDVREGDVVAALLAARRGAAPPPRAERR